MINRDNYEIYFIDYFDGNLSDADISYLFEFLDKHTELKQEFSSFEEVNIAENNTETLINKNELKQIDEKSEFSEDLFDAFAIGYIENDLTEKQNVEFLTIVNENKKLNNELNLYKATKLEVEENIVFENKESLKQKTIKVNFKPLRYAVAIAASLLLFFSLTQLDNGNEKQIAYVPRIIEDVFIAANTVEDDVFVIEDKVEQSQKVNIIPTIVKEKTLIAENIPEQIKEEDDIFKFEKRNFKLLERKALVKNTEFVKRETKSQPTNLTANVENNPTLNNSNSIKDLAVSFIKEKLLKVDENQNEKFNLWTLADLGVEQINKVANNKVSFRKELSKKGKVKSFSIFAGNFGIERN